MAPHHEPFKALCPVDWDSVPTDSLDGFLADTFSNAQTVIDSLPVPAAVEAAAASSARRGRSHTDPPLPSAAINRSPSTRQSGAAMSTARDLMKEWKEVKVNPRENPLSVNVYKLAAKDGRGSWFARRSFHDGMTFEKWKLGLEREFAESMKVQTGPGGGSIRGIGADKKAEHHVVDGVGKAEVFHLSAQFPGPTAPRDFVTLLLSSDSSHKPKNKEGQRPMRSFMILSKPCQHPECPSHPGYIRGQYESIEMIREVPTEKPTMRRARSSIDVSKENRQSIAEDMGREAVLRAAKQAAAEESEDNRNRGMSVDSAPAREESGHHTDGEMEDEEDAPTTIEWLMVTRSDPGGNVPRFMIERGTPGGIVSDAGKFLKWLTAKSARDFASGESTQELDSAKVEAVRAEETKARTKSLAPAPTSNLVPNEGHTERKEDQESETLDVEVPSSNGLYGIITGAFGMASSAVAGRLPNGMPGFFNGPNSSNEAIPEAENEDDDDDDGAISDESDTSSIRSFASAVERTESNPLPATPGTVREDTISTYSEESLRKRPTLRSATTMHEKDLKKLQDRRRKMHDKLAKLQSRMASKRTEDGQKDEEAASKLREKHDREVAKQEEKYRRELKRLEDKREQEERKAEAKKKKQLEKEEKANIVAELDKVKAERDLALKQVELLKAQVGELQGQNTMLVAEMGRAAGSENGDADGAAGGGAARVSGGAVAALKRANSTWSTASAGARSTASKLTNGSKGPATAAPNEQAT